MREADTFCWTCGAARDGVTEDRLEVVQTQAGNPSDRARPGRVIALSSVVLVAAVGVAAWWLLRPDDEPTATAQPSPTPSAVSPSSDLSASQPAPQPTPEPTPATVYPTGVIAPASVTAPRSAPDSADAAGRTTSYEAANMLDGRAGTAWRMEGSGVGESITFTFDATVRLTEVAVINGFAKTDPSDGTDRYEQGRRITAVTWTFTTANGPVAVSQDLLDGDRDLQRLAVAPVEATAVELTIDDVTSPGAGGRFDRTAVSEVEFSNS